MYRFKVSNDSNLAIFAIVISFMTIIVYNPVIAKASKYLHDDWSNPNILVKKPQDEIIYKIFKIPKEELKSWKRETIEENTKQLFSSEALYSHPNINNGITKDNFNGYTARRSANEISSAEKEYQTVRKALALDRAESLRRSMSAGARVMPGISNTPAVSQIIGNNENEKTIQHLLPLMKILASLIDKLDSPNGDNEVGLKIENERKKGCAKHSVTSLLKSLITNLEKEILEKRKNQEIANHMGSNKSLQGTYSLDNQTTIAYSYKI